MPVQTGRHTGRNGSRILRFVGVALLAAAAATAPAGARTWVVAQEHPRADDAHAGTADAPFKTIGAAADKAQPGDTVLVHAGIYRERVAPARGGELGQPIIYQGAPGQDVRVRGSEVYRGAWASVAGKPRLFTTTFDPGFFPTLNPFAVAVRASRGRGTLGQVFLDGALMLEVKTQAELEATPGSWLADPKGESITLHAPTADKPPGQHVVEISVRQRVFAPTRRGLSHLHVRGFTFEHACNHVAVPFQGMVSTRNGRYWLIENCTIRLARSVGLECGQEWGINGVPDEVDPHEKDWSWVNGRGYHLIRHNVVTDNGQTGIAGLKSIETRIVGNVVERNALIVPGFESAGIKMHLFWDGVVEGNLVRDNGSYGIWLDNGYAGARVSRNLALHNKLYGVFIELGEDHDGGCLVNHNVIAFNQAHGFYTHDASDVWLVHNLLLGNRDLGAWLHLATDRRSVSRWPDGRTENACSRNHLLNNLFVENVDGEISLPAPGGRSLDCRSDGNVFCPPAGREVRFTVNANNGLKVGADALSAEARKAFETSGDPTVVDSPLEMTKGGVKVQLSQWRVLLKADAASKPQTIRCGIDPKALTLTIAAPDLPAVPALPRRGADRDLANRPLPREGLRPGPWQDLAAGAQVYHLWPVALDTVQDVQVRAAGSADDAELQAACARDFLALAPLQEAPAEVARLAALGRECLARIRNAPALAARAAAVDYRLRALTDPPESALAALLEAARALPDAGARRQVVRFLNEAVATDAAAAVIDLLVDQDAGGEQSAWACGMVRELVSSQADPAARRRLAERAARWFAQARAAKTDADELARLEATEGGLAAAVGDVPRAVELLRSSAARATRPEVKAQGLYDAGRILFDAGRMDEARGLLEQAANTPSGGRAVRPARDLLRKIPAPPAPAPAP